MFEAASGGRVPQVPLFRLNERPVHITRGEWNYFQCGRWFGLGFFKWDIRRRHAAVGSYP